jgi:membrane-bound lytic murein transglycosylase MltF
MLLTAAHLALTACDRKWQSAEYKPRQAATSQALFPNESRGSTGESQRALALPASFGRRSGDLDEMVENRAIRALVIINPIGFFYTEGRPQGVQYELLQEFETFLNQTLNTGKLPVKLVFLPMRPDQLESALTQGLGDIIAHGVVITPEREQRVVFSTPFLKHVSHVVVTNSALATISSFDELAAKPIYVNPVTTYYEGLRKLSDQRQKNGKPALDIRVADKDLSDDDLVQMVNADLLPATVTYKDRGDLWAQVLPNVSVHPELVVADEGEMA